MVRRHRTVFTSLLLSIPCAVTASAQTRRVEIDRLSLGAGHLIGIQASDSNTVTVTITGGKFPLVAESTAEAARRWAALAESTARANRRDDGTSPVRSSERDEFGHFSDILLYQRFDSTSAPRHLIAIDVGPLNLALYSADVARPLLDRVTTSMQRAATVTDSLTTPSRRCYLQRDMEPLDDSGPNGYPAGTDLDEVLEPALRPDSPVPVYPRSANGARVTGNVIARFVIDTTGRPIIETFRMRNIANDLFVEAVCDALPRMQFVPSRVDGRAVPRLVERSFIIKPPVP